MTFDKYSIVHFDLARAGTPVPFQGSGPWYFVFWFETIPVGDCYFHNRPVQDAFFWRETLESIWPSLVAYHASSAGTPDMLTKPVAPTPSVLSELCREILDTCTSPGIPATANISVVVCTRDRALSLEKCLASLRRQACLPREIVVVDNASITRDTQDVVSRFAGVRYCREETPGLDIARNRGVREAGGEIVVFTDDDAEADPFWVYRVSKTFAAHPEVAAATGLIIAASLQTEAEVIFEKFWRFNRGYVPRLFDDHFFLSTLGAGSPVWEIGAGANMAFRKAVFDEVGYFDERLDAGAAGCSGDSEMWYRILAHGYSIRYDPGAVVYHRHRSSMADLKRQLFSYMRGFTVAILIQHQRFGHRGNLRHLLKVIPVYYFNMIKKGFPRYAFQYKTLLAELRGIFSGIFFFLKHRRTDPGIYY